MNNTAMPLPPTWTVMLRPFGALLVRAPAMPIWAMLVIGALGVSTVVKDQASIRAAWPVLAMVPSWIGVWATGPFYFFGTQHFWDQLPGARRKMSNLLVCITGLLALSTLALMGLAITSVFDLPSQKIHWPVLMALVMIPAFVNMPFGMAVAEILQFHGDKRLAKPITTFSLALTLVPLALFITQFKLIALLLSFTLIAVQYTVAMAGAWLIRYPGLRTPGQVPALLVGLVAGSATQEAHSRPVGQDGSGQPSWMIKMNRCANLIARAQKTGKRVWFVEPNSPALLVVKTSIFVAMTAFSEWQSGARSSHALPTLHMAMFYYLMFSIVLSMAVRNHPWLFLASLPVSRREMAADLTGLAARSIFVDTLIIMVVFIGVQIVVPRAGPQAWNAGWDAAVSVGLCAIIFSVSRMFIAINLTRKKAILGMFASGLGIALIQAGALGVWFLSRQAVAPGIWQWIALVALVVICCAWSLKFYHSLWMTAQFDGSSVNFSMKKAARHALGFA